LVLWSSVWWVFWAILAGLGVEWAGLASEKLGVLRGFVREMLGS
jgi:hypothetical protein